VLTLRIFAPTGILRDRSGLLTTLGSGVLR
jgi:hypothetical protein